MAFAAANQGLKINTHPRGDRPDRSPGVLVSPAAAHAVEYAAFVARQICKLMLIIQTKYQSRMGREFVFDPRARAPGKRKPVHVVADHLILAVKRCANAPDIA